MGAGRGEIIEPAVEVGLVGQHGQSGGATGLIGLDLIGKLDPGGDLPGAR